MEGEMDKGKNEEALDPIMMDEDQIKHIMETSRRTHSGSPYQYNMNTKKRFVVGREGLESDEEEVEDLWVVEQIEKILCVTYERKTRVPREVIEGNTLIHISVSVEPM
jgi:Zn ribbon nucleic-acid-binding protein